MAAISTMNSASAIEVMPSQVVRIKNAISATKDDTMGKVHHADDAKHHRVADGDQTVDGTEGDAVNELLDKHFHAERSPSERPARPPVVLACLIRLNRAGAGRQRRWCACACGMLLTGPSRGAHAPQGAGHDPPS